MTDNLAFFRGGGIYSTGALTIDGTSSVTGNLAGSGGGIYNNGGAVSLASDGIVTGNDPDNYAGDAVEFCINP